MNNTYSDEINCMKCKYFSVSWDPNFPRACKFYGFKSRSLPSVEVFNSSGADCMGFIKKDSKKRAADHLRGGHSV
ncbi:MAG: uracil-DNA glycosylase [Oscillospiraceae bacterium]|nr:uracil-DNA glycosylase [Oscillospiraceae bacterium]